MADISRKRGMMRIAKTLVKAALCGAVSLRLRRCPLSESAAERWALRIKEWPALFDDTLASHIITLDDGTRMQVGIVDHIERKLWFHKEWDRPVKLVLESLLSPGDAYFDLGTNIGYFTLLASRIVGPNGTVVAVEPSIRALRKLSYHLWLNRCSNVVLMSCAVGSEWSRSELGLATESNIGGSSLVAPGHQPVGRETVWIAPLDHLTQGLSLRPKVLKLDLEGYEYAALKGARETISQHQPWIICEVTEKLLQRFGSSTVQLFAILQDQGYRPYRHCQRETSAVWESTAYTECVSVNQSDVLFVPPGGDISVVKTQ